MEMFVQQAERIRQEFHLTQKEFDKRLGTENLFSRWKKGRIKKPNLETLLIIRKEFNKSLDWLLFGEEPKSLQPLQPIITLVGHYPDIPSGAQADYYLGVPLVGAEIAAGPMAEITEEHVEGFVWVSRQEIGRRQYHDLRAIRLAKTANSMRRTLRPGDIIIVDPVERPPNRPLNSRYIYAVRSVQEGGCAVKRVQEADDSWVLISDNPEYKSIILRKDQEDNPVIGQVIWSWTSWVR